ncbi:hypothetical protein BXZ70DRAFT_959678 [Cristinia sonorae]|uniref:Uncharacterized protein n=1 Tax=Cristinia sonorae TaxID=1940300 RepID=A0A8K0XKE4_9AGAR|nr:hypothetical protein BXZ70DRAFT_959678 [Cristinia sonorae]
MDYFNNIDTMDLLAELEAAGFAGGATVHDHQSGTSDHPEFSAAESATPVGTPLTEAPPSLHLPPQPTYSVSTAFHTNLVYDGQRPNVVLFTSDHVLFYAHISHLTTVSGNAFNGLLALNVVRNVTQGGTSLVVPVPEDSVLFNVIIHTIYSQPCNQYRPSIDTLLNAVRALKTYGVPLQRFVVPTTPLYHHIISEAPRRPIETYLVAAEHNLDAIAVASSAHLHSFPLFAITDDMAVQMGSIYLKRLVFLHIERVIHLARLILTPPKQHPDLPECGFVEQQRLSRAWALAAASLVGELRPDYPVGLLKMTFSSLEPGLECEACKAALNEKIRQVVLEWSTVIRRMI